MSTQTKSQTGEYKGSPVFKIFEVREDGAIRDVPTISFGVRKAELIIKHLKELEQFVKENK